MEKWIELANEKEEKLVNITNHNEVLSLKLKEKSLELEEALAEKVTIATEFNEAQRVWAQQKRIQKKKLVHFEKKIANWSVILANLIAGM